MTKEEILNEIKDQVAKENFGYNYEAKGIMIDSFWQIVAERYADLRLAEYKETSGWVSVKDRLPEVPEPGISSLKYVVFNTGRLGHASLSNNHDKSGQYWAGHDVYGQFLCGYEVVTHWMPLPELPKP